jgi:thiol-disulfide isomerase/thioredoxin
VNRREWVLTGLVAAGAAAAGIGVNAWRISSTADDDQTRRALAATELPDLDGKPQALRQWQGKVMVVNFWATWCGPCREEIPVFIRLQDRYRDRGLQFVGIAIDEPVRVRAYARELGINFPLLIAGMGGVELARVMGNRAGVLPYSLVLNRHGAVVIRRAGAFKEVELEPQVAALLSA